ncbi:MAG: TatD family hydrolase [Treponema sp.]|nr:TatD family hydrolase [Treponema sp.]
MNTDEHSRNADYVSGRGTSSPRSSLHVVPPSATPSNGGVPRNAPLCDAHFHLVQCGALPRFSDNVAAYYACTCAHDRDEFARQKEMIASCTDERFHIVSAFGIHPQAPVEENVSFLESLLRSGEIRAVGEAGFDLFTPEFSAQIEAQETVWRAQTEFAAMYGVPLVVHCRKAQERLFRDSKKLKLIPAVIFHSFAGSPQDAKSLLKRGVNGFFSFGKPLLNGKKSAVACVREIPLERILLETDAPFQTLKDETRTEPEEIARVYEAAANLRGSGAEEIAAQIRENFCAAYGIA